MACLFLHSSIHPFIYKSFVTSFLLDYVHLSTYSSIHPSRQPATHPLTSPRIHHLSSHSPNHFSKHSSFYPLFNPHLSISYLNMPSYLFFFYLSVSTSVFTYLIIYPYIYFLIKQYLSLCIHLAISISTYREWNKIWNLHKKKSSNAESRYLSIPILYVFYCGVSVHPSVCLPALALCPSMLSPRCEWQCKESHISKHQQVNIPSCAGVVAMEFGGLKDRFVCCCCFGCLCVRVKWKRNTQMKR